MAEAAQDSSDKRTPFERMTDFTRKVIQVPKDEIPEHTPRKRPPARKRK